MQLLQVNVDGLDIWLVWLAPRPTGSLMHILGNGLSQVTSCEFEEKTIILIDSLRIRLFLLVVMNMALHTFSHNRVLWETLYSSHVCIMEEEMVFDMSFMLIVFLIFTV